MGLWKMSRDKTTKTTINIDKELWTEFSIAVLRDKGGRKKNEVIEGILRKYLQDKSETRKYEYGK